MKFYNSRGESRSENCSENKGAKPGFTMCKLVFSQLGSDLKQIKFWADSKKWNFCDFLVFASKIAAILRL